MIEFVLPYLFFLYGAMYSLHQVLEGLWATPQGLSVSEQGGALVSVFPSMTEAVLQQMPWMCLYAAVLTLLLVIAVHTLWRRAGVLWLVLLSCVPGVLNCLQLWPEFSYLPRSVTLLGGAGALGSEQGLVPLLLLAMASGWALTVLLYDNFKFSERFRLLFDHAWFPLALVGAFFFVADNNAAQNQRKLQEAQQHVQQASDYLLRQAQRYARHCQAAGVEGSLSCRWSRSVQNRLLDNIESPDVSFAMFSPDSTRGYYAVGRDVPSTAQIIELRKQLAQYNQELCPVAHLGEGLSRNAPLSESCERVPFTYCTAFPDGPHGLVDKYIAGTTVAIASECIVPSLVALRGEVVKYQALVKSDLRAKNLRWLYFLLLAVLVGGKVANTSTKLANLDNRVGERQVLWRGMKRLSGRVSGLCARPMVHAATWLSKRWRAWTANLQ